MKTNNVDSLNEKNQYNNVWYKSYFDPTEFEVYKSKRTHWKLVIVFLLAIAIMFYFFFDILFLLIKLTR